MHRITATLLLLGALLAGLGVPPSRAQPREDILALMNQVSAANLNTSLLHLEEYGTRFCASDNAWPVAQDLLGRMQDLGWEAGLQEFTFQHDTLGVVTGWNVISRRAGLGPYPADATVILCAHWDTINDDASWDDFNAPAPGVNDNGSGVSCLLEIARILKDYRFYQNVQIVFFGGEEIWMAGSKAYVAQLNALGTNIAGVFNVDTVGYDADEVWDFSILSDHQSQWFMWNVRNWTWEYSPELAPLTFPIAGGWSNSDAYSFWHYHEPDPVPAVSIWEGHPDMPEEHAPFGDDAWDTYDNCISDYGIFLRAMTRNVLACFCEWAILGEKFTDVAALPGSAGVLTIHPNPFRDHATIRCARGDGSGATALSIYDLQGRRVRSLAVAEDEPAVWDGRDAAGDRLASGIYFVRADAHPELDAQRVVLLR